MKFEHYALNVPDARAMAKWYVEHCEMSIALSMQDEPFMHFLADASGRIVVEIYTNKKAEIPDYFNQHPLIFHHAFAVDDPERTKEKLLAAGASFFEKVDLKDGSVLLMLRDPWGIPLQLCKRAKAFN